MDDLARNLSQAAAAAFINRTTEHSESLRPSIIDNSAERQNDVLSYVKKGLLASKEFLISVSFIRMSGLEMLLQVLHDISQKDVRGRIITTDYLDYTEPKALGKLLEFDFIETRIVTEEAFHTKGYLFNDGEKNTIIVGSSNITGGALKSNREWNLRATSLDDGALASEFRSGFDEIWAKAKRLTEDFIQSYGERYDRQQEIRRTIQMESRIVTYTIEPNAMQKAAAASLHKLREEGKDKALLIAATGTGKTYLSAFDVRSFNPKHMLFVVHREQILRDAADSFIDILGTGIESEIGFITGREKEFGRKYTFSTIQTMSKDGIMHRFSPDSFDYIIIDEVHKASADSYQKIIGYFRPKFMLGMSATPDRPDKKNIYALFDYNIAIDIRLKEALENNLLCPFHYFGIADIKVDGEPLPEEADFNDLASDERVEKILEKSIYYGFSGERVKGLIFCSGVDEARLLSEAINRRRKNSERNWQTAYVTGDTPIEEREEFVERLQYDGDGSLALDFIITVDTFNEGIDIPKVNQVIMLRPTKSSIIFIQQLGRGLRKNAEGKEFLVVIDFIGNYRKSFLIPVALSGDRTYEKDNLRKYLTEGSSVIPGESTIDFDPISKDLIYRSIDRSNLQEMEFLKKEYFALKDRLGRIPSIDDFNREKAIDVRSFIEKSGSYYSFACRVDKDFPRTLSKDEETILCYISEKFEAGKRSEELLFLKDAIAAYADRGGMLGEDSIASFRFRESHMPKPVLSSMIANLDMSFLKKQDSDKFGSASLVSINDGIAIPSPHLARMLRHEEFRRMLADVVSDGFRRHEERYSKPYRSTPFTLYEKYTYEDVCRLLCWDRNMNALNIGGYFYDKKTKTLPVFINYEKDNGAIQYPDRFIDENTIIAASKKPRNIGCPDYEHIYKTTPEDKDNTIYLFVRKNTEDERKEFYFLGAVEAVGDAFPITVDGMNAFEICYRLDTPVRRDIYDYLSS